MKNAKRRTSRGRGPLAALAAVAGLAALVMAQTSEQMQVMTFIPSPAMITNGLTSVGPRHTLLARDGVANGAMVGIRLGPGVDPASVLDIGAQDQASGGAQVRLRGAGANPYFTIDNLAGRMRLVTRTGGAELERLTVTNAGAMGVGTSAPTAQLDVAGTFRVGRLSADPPGADGMIYYNSETSAFRGFQKGKWRDMVPPMPRFASAENSSCGGGWQAGTLTAACPPGFKVLACSGSFGDMGENYESYNLNDISYATNSCSITFSWASCPRVHAYCVDLK